MTKVSNYLYTSFPLSQIQQTNWFLHQLAPKGFADKVSFALRIKSPVDIAAIKAAFQTLIERHPSLQSTYSEDCQGNLIQEVGDRGYFQLEEIDAANWNLKELDRQILQLAQRPFDLQKPPVMRVSLLSRSTTEHILSIAVHQMASDRESLLILVDEFLTLLSGNAPNLPKFTQSYTDYVRQEMDLLKSSEGDRLLNYWKDRLAGELPVLDLPSNLSRPPIRTYDGSSYSFTVNNSITEQLRQLAQTKNVTLEAILLAAFKVLLYRYTGEEDILVALLQNRNKQPEFKGIIGNFLNASVARDSIDGNCSFLELVKQVAANLSEINEYQDYPFPALVKQLKSSPDLSHSPIWLAAFCCYDLSHLKNISKLFEAVASRTLIKCDRLELEYFEIPQQKVDFDLNLEIIELKESLLVNLKYNKDLLEALYVAQMAAHFENLLKAIAVNPQQSVAQLPLLSESEKDRLLFDWNATERDYNLSQSIHQLFEKQVERNPDAIALRARFANALVFEDQKLTYQDLNNRANQLAHYLQKLGVKPEVLVGICVERSLEMVVGLLGILKAGGAYVPIDPAYPQERLAHMLSDSQIPVLLTQENLQAALPEHQARVVCLDRDWQEISQESKENPKSEVKPENLAYIIYTSGSTGKPKGVQISHQSLTNFLYSMRDEIGLTEKDILLAVTTISFDIAALELYLPLIVGAQVELVRRQVAADGLQLLEKMVKSGATAMQATPATWNLLLAAGWQGSPQLKILCGGEALTRKLANQLLEKAAAVWNLYGPTETTIWSAIYKAEAEEITQTKETPVSIGRPIANTQIYILDSHLQPVPIGVTGELHIGGVGVARGYLNRQELTSEKFISSPFRKPSQSPVPSHQSPVPRIYKTGDLARYLPDENIEYVGRIDHQVKIRGFRIELGEIENALRKHPEVQEAVVIARSEKSGDKQLVAYIVPKQEKPLPNTVRSFLKQKLPDYMVPAAIVLLDSFPLTPNGKINRRALPAPDTSSFASASFVSPRNEIESQLAQIWSELLNLQQVGVKDDFFDLGGHSILAVQLMGKIKQKFGKTLPLTALFPSATIEELAECIRTESDTSTHSFHPCIVPIQPKGNKPPFFAVHPAWGHVLCYANLSRYLGKDRPFYGLRAIGFNEGEKPLERVEDMASLYIEAIRTVQPEGPYQIGGWSFGGVVAFEIAQQLQRMGQEVSRLALLDSYVPILLDKNKKIDDVYLVGVLSRVFGGMYGRDNLVTPEELEGLSIQEQIEYITEKARKVNIFPPEVEGQNNRRIVDVLVGTLKATYAYQRQPYPGKVIAFRAQEKHIMAPDPTLVWVELFVVMAAKEIEIIKVPGSHYTFILEPNLPVLAERLGACLS